MAVGKNKRLSKKGKGAKKKVVDPFTRKDWYDVKAPTVFSKPDVGKTLVNRTQANKIASETLKGRVFEVSLGDLNADEDQAHVKMRLIAEEVRGKDVLTNFHGMCFTTDKLRSLVKKRQTLIEAFVDIKTTDGYGMRLFVIAFTKHRQNQERKTSYAQQSQIRQIRKKMVEIVAAEVAKSDFKELVNKLIAGSVSTDITKATRGIYPLQNVFIRKVKILKKPKFDLSKLKEMHGEMTGMDSGSKVARAGEFVEPKIQDTV